MSADPAPAAAASMPPGLAMAKILANHSSPMKSRRTPSLSDVEEQKRRLALSQDGIWLSTGVPTVRKWEKKEKKKRGFRVHLLKYATTRRTKGNKRASTIFATEHEAEAHIFEFRYSMESPTSRAHLDEHVKYLEGKKDSPISVERPKKTPRLLSHPHAERGLSMSGNPALRLCDGASPDKNPKTPGPFNRFNSEEINNFLSRCAGMIQHQWSRRRRRRAITRMKLTLESQALRGRLIAELREKIVQRDWTGLLEGGADIEVQWMASTHDREHVIDQARAICRALEILYEATNNNQPIQWINGCCRMASEQLNIASDYTIARWYREFFQGEDSDGVQVVERFPWSLRGRMKSNGIQSPFDAANGGDEELMLQFKRWAKENLEELSVERSVNWLNNKLSDWTAAQLNDLNIELPVKPHAVSVWMKDAGFIYSQYKKSYAVNTHERPDVVAARKKYVNSFLDGEINQAVWVQLKLEEAIKFFVQTDDKDLESNESHLWDDAEEEESLKENLYWVYRHEYQADDGTPMVELPVYAYTYQQVLSFMDGADPVWKLLGGFPSVRKPPEKKIEVWFGQDESVFNSHSMNESCWKVDGIHPERNKGEGTGRMVSGMQSYAFGYGMSIGEEDLAKINELRSGERYCDEEAAKELYGSAVKLPLEGSPFSVLFDFGKAKSGYWGYKHMICQLEDCVDCLRHLHAGDNGEKFAFDFVFEFDHSSGHSKQRPDGLNVMGCNLGFGGRQPKMRDTVITDATTELGNSSERVLSVGDVQRMVFAEDDPPPVVDPDAPKQDVARGAAFEKEKSAAELREELRDMNLFELACGKAADVKMKARNAGIELKKMYTPTTFGYVGKAKGLKQIAWERGFWTAKELAVKGGIKEDTIKTKLSMCHDFATEKSQMQHIAEELGVRVVMTPKAHPELAGQGIEYSWGYTKLTFRKNNTARSSKEKAQQLEANVLAATATTGNNLHLERVRKFVRKARDYKVVYREHFKALEKLEMLSEQSTDQEENEDARNAVANFQKFHFSKIEKQVQDLKAHRAAVDIDTKFIKES